MRKLNNKAPIVFYVSMVLLCAVLISAYMTNDLYASYATYAFGGDSARVAKFDVEYSIEITDGSYQTMPVDLGTIYPGGKSKDIVVNVTNESEVAVEVKVELVNLTNNLPLTIVKGADSTLLQPNSNTETSFIFNVFWIPGANDLSLMGMTDMFELRITFEQVD
ncbi:MAG: hypothetical protein IKK01_02185 [Clostridia bacterium]|nr:hypothetical protein [Clostridia bacterium]